MNKEIIALLAKDLTKDVPRSPRETLGGYVLGARILDKCRAVLNGTNGEYHFDCPLDNFLFSFTGIQSDAIKEFIATGATDAAVGEWIQTHATQRPRAEIIQWNNSLREKRISELPGEIQEYLEDYIPANLPKSLTNRITVFFDIYDVEEGRLV